MIEINTLAALAEKVKTNTAAGLSSVDQFKDLAALGSRHEDILRLVGLAAEMADFLEKLTRCGPAPHKAQSVLKVLGRFHGLSTFGNDWEDVLFKLDERRKALVEA
jgi:hypothetical protein